MVDYIPEKFPNFNHGIFLILEDLNMVGKHKITKDFIGKSIPLKDYQKICHNTYSNFFFFKSY